MQLRDILRDLQSIDEDAVILAKQPWMLDSEAELGKFDLFSRIPASITDQGFAYFLEVHIAKEFLEDLGNSPSTEDERFARLIYYAENDA
jgi:hypothetical protein